MKAKIAADTKGMIDNPQAICPYANQSRAAKI
jgi:hypothetical protein